MWRTMYDCHQVQNHIALQINSVSNHISCEPVSALHIKATHQLENETVAWYNSYCNLLRSQRNYVHTLNHWVQLTDFLPDSQFRKSSSSIHSLCEEWQQSLDILPEKVSLSFTLNNHQLRDQLFSYILPQVHPYFHDHLISKKFVRNMIYGHTNLINYQCVLYGEVFKKFNVKRIKSDVTLLTSYTGMLRTTQDILKAQKNITSRIHQLKKTKIRQ